MKEDFLSVNALLIIAVALSIVLVGYNAFMIPTYSPPVVTSLPDSYYAVEAEVPLDEALTEVINLNLATELELQAISGIGEVMAQNLVEYRNKVGVITNLEEILNVKGIGEATYEKISPYLVLE